VRRRLALVAIVLATVTLAAVAWVLQLWHADLGVPLRYPPLDDTKFYVMLVKGIIEHGSYLTNSALGAPFGQQLYDFPQGDGGAGTEEALRLGLDDVAATGRLDRSVEFVSSHVRGLPHGSAHAVQRGFAELDEAGGGVGFHLLGPLEEARLVELERSQIDLVAATQAPRTTRVS